MTTQPDINAIAIEAANACRFSSNLDGYQTIIASAIRRAIKDIIMPAEIKEQARLINERNAVIELKEYVDRVVRQRDEAIEVLKSLEWFMYRSHGKSRCPVCGGWQEHDHNQNCKLAKAIGK